MSARIPASLVLAAVLAACNPPTSAPSIAPTGARASASSSSPSGAAASGPAGSLDRVAGWQSDITELVPGMARLHKDLFHGVGEEALNQAAAELSATVPNATDDQILDGVLRIVGMVSAGGCDAHTGAYIWGSGRYPVDSLPLRLWLFGDDVVVVDALPPYEPLVGTKVTAIEGHPIGEALQAVDPLVPRDNEETVRLLIPRFLLIPQVLRGLGLADDGAVTIGIRAADGGAASSVDVTPVPMATYNAWAGPYGLHLPADPDVLYLSRIDDALWWQVLDDGETLFVQHNRVDRLDAKLFSDLGAAMREPAISRVVLDLRHNYGGELDALEPMEALFRDPSFDEHGRLFVATGRNTFSAGSLLVARLKRDTAAEIVGEPMGGCPTFWSDPVSLTLPWSGIEVGVAGDVAIGIDVADTRHGILPDTALVLTIDDWLAGVDPVLNAFAGSGP